MNDSPLNGGSPHPSSPISSSPISKSPDLLRREALAIWWAGVEAVRSEHLVRQALRVDGNWLSIGEDRLPLDSIRRIVVVGAGKAGAGMAAGVEAVLGPQLMDQKHLSGRVNVPEDCVRPLTRIRLHGARPAGVNEPTQAGVAGAEEILRLVGSLGDDDLCLCLISGGGSALLPAPCEGILLEDKLAVTRFLSAAGANIEQLNTVRKQLSRIKGGGLARACRAGWLATLIISDVLGDPLDVIASGPTVPDSSTPEAAIAVLEKFDARAAGISPRVFDCLQRPRPKLSQVGACRVSHHVIGNIATAVNAAADEAMRRGYLTERTWAAKSEGLAEDLGRALAEKTLRLGDQSGRRCVVSGGEPVVKLADASRRGVGGRNQQLVLAAALRLWDDPRANRPAADSRGWLILSGGTDGEDGPTDAAGAFLDGSMLAAARAHKLDPAEYLARNDAYHFFEPLGGLIRTGPTNTNVCDIRVALVG